MTSSIEEWARSIIIRKSGAGHFDADRFRELRRRFRVTQQEVADAIEVDRSAVTSWERPHHRKRPDQKHAKQLAQIMAVWESILAAEREEGVRR